MCWCARMSQTGANAHDQVQCKLACSCLCRAALHLVRSLMALECTTITVHDHSCGQTWSLEFMTVAPRACHLPSSVRQKQLRVDA